MFLRFGVGLETYLLFPALAALASLGSSLSLLWRDLGPCHGSAEPALRKMRGRQDRGRKEDGQADRLCMGWKMDVDIKYGGLLTASQLRVASRVKGRTMSSAVTSGSMHGNERKLLGVRLFRESWHRKDEDLQSHPLRCLLSTLLVTFPYFTKISPTCSSAEIYRLFTALFNSDDPMTTLILHLDKLISATFSTIN